MIELRPWHLDDARAVLVAFDSADLDNQGGPLHTVDEARDWIKGLQRGVATDRARALAIAAAGDAVGGVAISAIEHRHNTAWVSYWLSPAVRGQGLAVRATATLARYAFEELGLFRLELGHRVNNPASCAVATRAGFRAEGIERAKLRYGDERFDTETHARLATDRCPTRSLCRFRGDRAFHWYVTLSVLAHNV